MADIYIGNVKGPQGDTGATGPQGAAGDAATVNVGTVSTTAYGNPAQVVNSGTEHAAVLNFTIPQGAPGATVTQLDNLALNTITTSTDQYPQIQVGDLGRVIFGKIIKFFQDLVTGLAAKVNYSDAFTMEEIEAASDLTDKVSAAAASKTLKESLSTIGTVYTSNVIYQSSLSAGANTLICKVDDVPKGTYIAVATVRLNTAATGNQWFTSDDNYINGLSNNPYAYEGMTNVLILTASSQNVGYGIAVSASNTVRSVRIKLIRIA